MQAWQSHPARCIFCAFRRTKLDRVGNIRSISSSVPSDDEYRFKPRRRSRDDDDGYGGRDSKDRLKSAPRTAESNRHLDLDARPRDRRNLMNRSFGRSPRDNDGDSRAPPRRFDKVKTSYGKSSSDSDRRPWSRDHEKRRGGGLLLNKDGNPLIRAATSLDTADYGFKGGRRNGNERDFSSAELDKRLADLESSMRKYKPHGQEKSQMQLLDPNGTKWNAFRREMQTLHTKASSGGKLSSEAQETWTVLSRAEDKADLEKQLFFAFMDSMLDPAARNLTTLEENPLMDLRFPTEWYAPARKTQRQIHLHVGPTNSGKTYNALKRLQESKDGFYAGPLRLLAHEVYSRFRANGIACDLVTGDDIRYDESEVTKVYASTVEMVDCSREVEVAVIDEIQMLGHEERGWAWTRAFLGANAKEVHLCGEERVVPLIRELAASMGDTLQVHNYQRLNPLKCMSKSLRGNLKTLRRGDCIVAFSVREIHELKKQIEVETGKRCAIVYGSLPPETRAEQADLFNNPDNDYDYLVASDAIGMGLNLSVKRIIFNKVTRFDGTKSVLLSVPQIKQIAGRAGRFRSAHQDKHKVPAATPDIVATKPDEETVGWVTTLDEADLPIISKALSTEAPPLKRAGLNPPAEFLEEFNNRLPPGTPFEYLIRTVNQMAKTHPRFFLCDIRDRLMGARLIEDVSNLTIEQRVNLCAAPIGGRSQSLAECFKAIARVISKMQPATVVDIAEIPVEVLAEEPSANRTYLASLEDLHKCLIMYLWLSYRFGNILKDQPMAVHAKELTEQKINWTLRTFSANPLLAKRLKKLQNATPTDGSISAETARYLEALKQMEAEQEKEKAASVEPEVAPTAENQIQELIGDETFDEHFAAPAEFVSEPSGEVLDEAGTLEVDSKEQMAEPVDAQPEEPKSQIQLDLEPQEDVAESEDEPEKQRASSGGG